MKALQDMADACFRSQSPQMDNSHILDTREFSRNIREVHNYIKSLEAQAVKLVEVFNAGYAVGHHDTVEGCYVDILPEDAGTLHKDVVEQLIYELEIKDVVGGLLYQCEKNDDDESMARATHFVCPKCGGRKYGTANTTSDFNNAVGHCHNYKCRFKWMRKDDDAEGVYQPN